MNRTKRYIYNTWSAALYQIIVMISGFIMPKVILTIYGSETNGLVTSVTQFINYFALVEAGLSGAAIFALYKPLAENDMSKTSRIIVATKNLYKKSGLVFAAMVLLLALFYPLSIKTEALTHVETGFIVLIIGINGALEFFTLGKYRAILIADQRQYIISLASTLCLIINTSIFIVLANFGISIVLVRLFAISAICIRSLIISLYCHRKYHYIDYAVQPDNKALNKRWDALILQILGAVHSGSSVVLITFLTTLKDVSVYSVFNMVIIGVNGVLSIFGSGLSASFGDIIVRKETKKLQHAYNDFEFIYYILVTIVYSIALIQIMPFIQIYTHGISDTNYSKNILGYLFVINGFLYNMKTPQGILVISAGLFHETRWQTITQSAIAIVSGILFGIKMGLAGIMVGMCLSNFYRIIDLVLFIPHYVTHLPIWSSARRLILSCLEMAIIYIICTNIQLDNSSVLNWIKYSLFAFLLSSTIVLTSRFLFDHNQFISVLKRIKSVLKANETKYLAD